MICKFFPSTRFIAFFVAIFFSHSLYSGIFAAEQAAENATKVEEGFVRLLMNMENQSSVVVSLSSNRMEEPLLLYDGSGRLFVGGYFEVPAGTYTITLSIDDRTTATSEIEIRDREFFTVNLMLPLKGSSLLIEKDAPMNDNKVTQRFRIFNFTGNEFRTAVEFANNPPRELARNEVHVFTVPEGTHPIEVLVSKPATGEFGKVISEGKFGKGQSLTMVLFNDYRNKVSSRIFYDGILD